MMDHKIHENIVARKFGAIWYGGQTILSTESYGIKKCNEFMTNYLGSHKKCGQIINYTIK